MTTEFIRAIKANQSVFGFELASNEIELLSQYHRLITEASLILHLVAPCSAEEFAVRHVLESLTLLEFLGSGWRFADIGAGGGLPSIPCLIVRPDLSAVLIESKVKKARFLTKTLQTLGLSERAEVACRQFEEVKGIDCQAVTCRALDRFSEKLPRLLKWSPARRRLFFGGIAIEKSLAGQHIRFKKLLMPLSRQRFLFVIGD